MSKFNFSMACPGSSGSLNIEQPDDAPDGMLLITTMSVDNAGHGVLVDQKQIELFAQLLHVHDIQQKRQRIEELEGRIYALSTEVRELNSQLQAMKK